MTCWTDSWHSLAGWSCHLAGRFQPIPPKQGQRSSMPNRMLYGKQNATVLRTKAYGSLLQRPESCPVDDCLGSWLYARAAGGTVGRKCDARTYRGRNTQRALLTIVSARFPVAPPVWPDAAETGSGGLYPLLGWCAGCLQSSAYRLLAPSQDPVLMPLRGLKPVASG